ncbi:putative polyketide synthase protein [Microtetraspora sp. NBRC 13810]|uniref:class I SAM-dependent methyltransferase n=1 Tax=Microtetraspora sp. NBRC 13810 TaxID=3030990 RepID=UPI0024A4930C|nr:class I SAM-dependent methyltransferase [Microtetraspora sp. NBRC 13810]GLW12751.1 putative polyketide synthase protein [Microtetraspora sp. NBRC 13810]
MHQEKITLSGAQETLLATLYGRALDNREASPILGDREAGRAVERIAYDFAGTGMRRVTAAGVALRARQLDEWTAEFLAAHPEATVLHLACGLDTRPHRLAPPPSVRWFDVDYPEVLDLRERLLPRPGGDYRTIASSVTDDGWLAEVPADRPTVAVFEGLTMYLREEEGRRLIQRITGRFGTGQLLFDCYGTFGIRIQKLNRPVRNAGATLYWGIDDPRELEGWHDGLRCLDDLRAVDMPGIERFPAGGRIAMRVMAALPGFRDAGRILRYAF